MNIKQPMVKPKIKKYKLDELHKLITKQFNVNKSKIDPRNKDNLQKEYNGFIIKLNRLKEHERKTNRIVTMTLEEFILG
jgi:hypothetical protein